MDNLTKKFEEIKDSKDPDVINDFLIELGKYPKKDHLSILDYFIENYDPVIFNQIKLNVIFNIGEIGIEQSLDNKYIDFLIEEYYSSDRWVRNEILSTLNKIANHTKLPVQIFETLKYAMLDDYLPISINAMKVIMHYENIADDSFKKIFNLLRTSDLKLQDQISNVLKKFIKNESRLFELLTDCNNYKSFNKKALRSLLIIYFNSAMSLSNLESFRKLLENSEWEIDYKEMFFNEIDTYEKLLLRGI